MKKKRGNSLIIWSMILFIVAATALVVVPQKKVESTKEKAIININETYNDEFIITHSNLSKTPFKNTFSAIVQSQQTGASYNARFKDGVGTIPDYEQETYHMTFNTVAEETFDSSLALTYTKDDVVHMRVFTSVAVTEEKQQAFVKAVKEMHPEATGDVELLLIDQESFEQMEREIPLNYQRNIIAEEANFDNFNPTKSNFTF